MTENFLRKGELDRIIAKNQNQVKIFKILSNYSFFDKIFGRGPDLGPFYGP